MADVFSSKASFLYKDGKDFHFMDSSSFEQFSLSEEFVGDAVYYIQENMEVGVTLFNSDPIGIDLPNTVVLTIAETAPELKGATAANSPKPATTDTGLVISVPPFIKEGEKVVVNTEDGSYLNRAE